MKPGPYFVVTAGTRPTKCKTCGQQIYWIKTATGKQMPVDCAGNTDCLPPSTVARGRNASDGQGVSHFATCRPADLHRKPR